MRIAKQRTSSAWTRTSKQCGRCWRPTCALYRAGATAAVIADSNTGDVLAFTSCWGARSDATVTLAWHAALKTTYNAKAARRTYVGSWVPIQTLVGAAIASPLKVWDLDDDAEACSKTKETTQ